MPCLVDERQYYLIAKVSILIWIFQRSFDLFHRIPFLISHLFPSSVTVFIDNGNQSGCNWPNQGSHLLAKNRTHLSKLKQKSLVFWKIFKGTSQNPVLWEYSWIPLKCGSGAANLSDFLFSRSHSLLPLPPFVRFSLLSLFNSVSSALVYLCANHGFLFCITSLVKHLK